MEEGSQNVIIVRLTSLALPELVRIENESSPAPWSSRLFEDEFRCDYAVVLGARKKGAMVGFLVYHRVVDELHVLNIAVEENSRRQGVASALLQDLLRDPENESVRFVTLEVRASNISAQALYRKFGFEEVGVRRGYYSDNQEDAILMTLKGS